MIPLLLHLLLDPPKLADDLVRRLRPVLGIDGEQPVDQLFELVGDFNRALPVQQRTGILT